MRKGKTILETMTEETIIAICYDYMDKTITTRQIVEKYHISYGTLMDIVDKNNVPHRNPKHKTRNRKKANMESAPKNKEDAKEEIDINIRTFNGMPIVDGRVYDEEDTKETQNNIDAFYDGELRSKKVKKKEKPVEPEDTYVPETARKCECGCTYNPANAKFCCACGHQLRTDKEIIIFNIEKLCDYLQFAANGTRDKFRDDILKIIEDVNTKLTSKM